MKAFKANYKTFGEKGEFERPAKTVGELPHLDRLPALQQAAQSLSIKKIHFGIPIWITLKLKKSEANADSRDWIMFSGENLPLRYVNS